MICKLGTSDLNLGIKDKGTNEFDPNYTNLENNVENDTLIVWNRV